MRSIVAVLQCALLFSALSAATQIVPSHHYVLQLGLLLDETGTTETETATEVLTIINIANTWIQRPGFFTYLNTSTGDVAPLSVALSGTSRDTVCDPLTSIYQAAAVAVPSYNVLALIGPPCDQPLEASSTVSEEYTLPQINYGARSDVFNNNQLYPLIAGVVGSHSARCGAIIRLLMHYNWNHFTVLASHSTFGTELLFDLQQQSERWNLSILDSYSFQPSISNWTVLLSGVQAVQRRGGHVFVLASDELLCQELLFQLNEAGLMTPGNVWIAGGAVCTDMSLNGSLTLIESLLPGVIYVDESINSSSATYQRFLLDYQNVTRSDQTPNLEDMLFFDSIMAVMHSLRSIMYGGVVPSPYAGAQLLSELLHNVSFEGSTGQVSFSPSDGSRIGVLYGIWQINDSGVAVPISIAEVIDQTRTYDQVPVPIVKLSGLNQTTLFWPGLAAGIIPLAYTPPATSSSDTSSSGPPLSSEAITVIVVVLSVSVVLLVFVVSTVFVWRHKNKRIMISLQEAYKARSQFLANMTHEIRTPMNGVFGMTEELAATELTSDQKECVQSIQLSATHLLHVVNTVLLFGKAESGKMDLDLQACDLVSIVDDAVNISGYQKIIDECKPQSEIVTYIDPRLPRYVTVDETQLRQVITNLVSNAVKFGNGKDILVKVTEWKATTPDQLFELSPLTEDSRMSSPDFCAPFQHSRWSEDEKMEMVFLNDESRQPIKADLTLLITVEDQGAGIPKDHLNKLFQSFCQSDSSISRKYGGTGLGLAISAKLVELMGGRIWCESRIGVGSKFSVVISTTTSSPAAATTAPSSELNNDSPSSINSQTSRSGPSHMAAPLDLNVVILSSHHLLLATLASTLHAWGARVCTTSSRDSAWSWVEKHPTDVLVIDSGFLSTGERVPTGPFVVLLNDTNKANQIPVQVDAKLRRPLRLSKLFRVFQRARVVAATSGTSNPHNAHVCIEMTNLLPDSGEHCRSSSAPAAVVVQPCIRILCVEDNDINQKLFIRLMSRYGYKVDVAKNGLVAISKLRESIGDPYDIIFMDMHMPELDGLSTAALISATYGQPIPQRFPDLDPAITLITPGADYNPIYMAGQRLPPRPIIIALTANATDKDRGLCLACGMNDYITKPFKGEVIREKVKKWGLEAIQRREAWTC